MDYQKLYEALMMIRDTCDEMQKGLGCDKCPMRTSTGCGVYHSHPFKWDVIPPETKLMR